MAPTPLSSSAENETHGRTSWTLIFLGLVALAVVGAIVVAFVLFEKSRPFVDSGLSSLDNGDHQSDVKQFNETETKQHNKTDLKQDHKSEVMEGRGGFYHGVASGSPLPDAVILWTRYSPRHEGQQLTDSPRIDEVTIEYRIAKVPRRQADGNDNENESTGMDYNDLLDPKRNGMNIRHGRVVATADNDWTVKLDITGLEPKTTYVYAFSDGDQASPVGVTKTAPAGDDPMTEGLRFAVFSCSNYRLGYFHAYNIARRIRNLDFWVHVGDYIYEAAGKETDARLDLKPRHELLTLQDYRQRYQTYHTDIALQQLRAAAPVIATWDDHEIADNAHRTGSRKHDEADGDGSWPDRVGAGVQAYFEWMPIRPGQATEGDTLGPYVKTNVTLTQTFQFGSLATLFSCDTRLGQRTAEAADNGDPIREYKELYAKDEETFFNISSYRMPETTIYRRLRSKSRSILARQYDPQNRIVGEHLVSTMSKVFYQSSQVDKKPWQVLAVPVMMAYNVWPPFDRVWESAPNNLRQLLRSRLHRFLTTNATSTAGRYRSTIPLEEFKVCQGFDDWCGAAHERTSILQSLQSNANTAMVLGGDLHTAWAATLYEDGNHTGIPVAVNIGTPSVTAGGEEDKLGVLLEPLLENVATRNRTATYREWIQVFHEAWYAFNEGIEYANLVDRGFVAVELTHKQASYEFFHVDELTLHQNYQEASTATTTSDLPPFYCGISLRSDAFVPGSLYRVGGWQLNRQESCDNTFSFDANDNPLTKILVPPLMMSELH